MSAYRLHAADRLAQPDLLTLSIKRSCGKAASKILFRNCTVNTFKAVRPKANNLERQGANMFSAVRATLLTASAVCLIPIGTAHAKFSFLAQYGSWWGNHAPFRHNHQHRHTKSESAKENQPQETLNGPLQIVISIADQRISLYDNGILIGRSSVSTGVRRHPTPLGVFSVIEKERWHRSNIYSGAPMPY